MIVQNFLFYCFVQPAFYRSKDCRFLWFAHYDDKQESFLIRTYHCAQCVLNFAWLPLFHLPTFKIPYQLEENYRAEFKYEHRIFLTLSTLGKIFSRHFHFFLLFFPENRFWHFMHIVPIGDSLYEISKPIFLENKKNIYQNVICWRFYQEVYIAGLGGSVGCAVPLETRRSRVQPLPRSATFFRGDWSWNIFYGHSLPSADSRRAVVSFWRKNVHNTG